MTCRFNGSVGWRTCRRWCRRRRVRGARSACVRCGASGRVSSRRSTCEACAAIAASKKRHGTARQRSSAVSGILSPSDASAIRKASPANRVYRVSCGASEVGTRIERPGRHAPSVTRGRAHTVTAHPRPAGSRDPVTSGAAVPAADPGSPSPRTPRATRPGYEGARGSAPRAGMRKMHGGRTAQPEGRADPRGRCRGAAFDALPKSAAFPAPVPGVTPASLPPRESVRSPIAVRPMVGLPPPAPVPSPTPVSSPPPAPLPAPISSPSPARRRHPRCRSRAGPADRRRAAAPAPPPGSGRPAGADLRAPPSPQPSVVVAASSPSPAMLWRMRVSEMTFCML